MDKKKKDITNFTTKVVNMKQSANDYASGKGLDAVELKQLNQIGALKLFHSSLPAYGCGFRTVSGRISKEGLDHVAGKRDQVDDQKAVMGESPNVVSNIITWACVVTVTMFCHSY